MIRSLTALLLFTLFLMRQVGAADALPIPASIQEAEAEGAAFPSEVPPPTLHRGFEGKVEGTDERKCVALSDGAALLHARKYRSGDFVVGAEIIVPLKAGISAKVAWMPLHDPASRKATLLIRSSRQDEPGMTSRFASSNYSWPANGPGLPSVDNPINWDNAAYVASACQARGAGSLLLLQDLIGAVLS